MAGRGEPGDFSIAPGFAVAGHLVAGLAGFLFAGLALGLLPSVPGQVEQAAVWCPRVQHRRAPLGRVALIADCPAGLSQSGFQG